MSAPSETFRNSLVVVHSNVDELGAAARGASKTPRRSPPDTAKGVARLGGPELLSVRFTKEQASLPARILKGKSRITLIFLGFC